MAAAFTVARKSIQENLQIWNIRQLITVNVRTEANLNRNLLQFPLECTALRYTWSFQGAPWAKLIAHPCTTRIMVIHFAPNKSNHEAVEEQAVWPDHKLFNNNQHVKISLITLKVPAVCMVQQYLNVIKFREAKLKPVSEKSGTRTKG